MINLGLKEYLPNNRVSSDFKLAYDKLVLYTNSIGAEGLSVTRDFQKVRYKLPL